MAELVAHCPPRISVTFVKFSPRKQIYTQDLLFIHSDHNIKTMTF